LPHYLVKSKWSTIQLYSTVSSVQSDEKRLITANVHKSVVSCHVYLTHAETMEELIRKLDRHVF